MLKSLGGLGGAGEGTKAGSGGKGEGFGSRGAGVRKAMLGNGGTKDSERAVAAALNWLARHQLHDGNWSLGNYQQVCKDGTCTGKGAASSDAAATAMALLPFLAAGQTHKEKGPYKRNIEAGLYLAGHQPKGGWKPGGRQWADHVYPRPGNDLHVRSLRAESRQDASARRLKRRLTLLSRRRTPNGAVGITTERPTNRAILRSSAGKSWRSRAASWPD